MFLSCALTLSLFGVPLELQSVGKVKFESLDEMSGITMSRSFKDTYWVHNDSGDSARLFAIRRDGAVIMPAKFNRKEDAGKSEKKKDYEGIKVHGASNMDWEDIAIDGDTLYVADTGNNLNFRKDLCVYVLKEPDPMLVSETHILERIAVAYPDQKEFPPQTLWNFDCEALAVNKGKLYFVTKWRSNSAGLPGDGAAIYVLDKRKPNQVNTLKILDVNTTLGGWVTAAEISPDGKTLAVLVQAPKQSIWLFDMTKGSKLLSHPIGRAVFNNGKQCEAICWESNQRLIVTNEQSDIFALDRPSL